MTDDTTDPVLVAVDLGLRTGIAVYGPDGRLRSFRSQNFGSRSRLKRGAEAVLRDHAHIGYLVAEGDVALAQVWGRAAARRGGELVSVQADEWRLALLHPSQRRTGADAKRHADTLARAVVEWSGTARPTSLRHDAAEAVLVGLWGVLRVGWLDGLPPALDPARRGG